MPQTFIPKNLKPKQIFLQNFLEKQPTDYKCPNGGKIYQIIKSQCEQYLFENVNINKRLSHSGNTKPIFT